MPSEKRRAQSIGIPQVIKTPEELDLARTIREAILAGTGRPVPENFGDYGDYLEALVVWKLDQPLSQAAKALNPQEKRRRMDNANIQIVKLARQAIKTFRRAS